MFLLNRSSKKNRFELQAGFWIGGVFFLFFFWGVHFFLGFLVFGFWLLAWLLAYICCILEPKSLICVLFAAVWSQFACPFGFWLLASGSFGFWLLACICCILELKSLICVLFAAVWSQFACPFGFWLLALASLDSWLLVFGFCCFFGFGFTFGFWPHFC